MAPRKPALETGASTAVEPTRRSTRIAEKPKPAAEEKPAPKPRTKKAATAPVPVPAPEATDESTAAVSKKREAKDDAEAAVATAGDNGDTKKKRGSADEAASGGRSAKKVKSNSVSKPKAKPKEEPPPPPVAVPAATAGASDDNGEEQDELADDKDDDIPGELKPINLGDVLPSFVIKNEKDEDVDVAHLAAEKSLVLFLVPKADTPGCTQQACGFRDIYQDFEPYDVDVYCLSADAPSAQTKWQSKKSLPYSLLSDPQRTLIKALGAGDNNKTKRSHFIFEKGGKLVEKKVPVKPVDSPKLALEYIEKNLKKKP